MNELNKDIKEIFTGFCQKEKHNEELEFFCKTHNELCCASCLCVIKEKGKGQHSSCNSCVIEEIKEEKKNSLINNIKYLEDLSNKLGESIDNLKKYFKNIEERKENLKNKFMKIFTNLRNALNNREDEIMLEIENEFERSFFKEDIIKTAEKLPNNVKNSIENGKMINNIWDDQNKLNFIIYNCLNIENNIKDIKLINDNIEKCKDSEKKIHIKYEEKNFDDEVKDLLQIIKYFATEDKLNIFIKQKEIEKENNDLKQRIKKIYTINDNIIKNITSKFYESNTSFSIRSCCDERTCLDTPSCGENISPHLWEYIKSNKNQIFSLIKNKDGTYSIKNSSSGYFLGMEISNEKWKIVSRKKGENYQKFKLIYGGEKDHIIFLNEKGKVIDLINMKTSKGENIEPNDLTFSLGQQWKLIEYK